jgi:hypothetical protein
MNLLASLADQTEKMIFKRFYCLKKYLLFIVWRNSKFFVCEAGWIDIGKFALKGKKEKVRF